MITFTITHKSKDQIRAYSDDINWTFTFDLDGCMVDGFEMASNLMDEGEALSEWALTADVGDSADFAPAHVEE